MFDPLGALLGTVGPFVIPVALFVAGLVGYGVLVALGRTGLLSTAEDDETESPDSGDGWQRR